MNFKKTIYLLLLLAQSTWAELIIEQWTTPEGAKVLFAQSKGLPMLDIVLNFDAAGARDGDKFGLAALTNGLLGSATKYHNEEQIIDTFDALGAKFSKSSAKDRATVSLRTLTRPEVLRKSLQMFAEVVAEPKFEQKYLSRAKRQTLVRIEAGKQSPNTIASQAFAQAVFANHAYAHSAIGSKKTLENIVLKDIIRHYKKYYVAKNLTITLVGDISQRKAKQISRKISQGFNIGNKASAHTEIKPLTTAVNQHIKFPSKQTHLLIGQVGISRSHPDYYALYLGNHILGGSALTSILGEQIREQKGLAYSVSSRFIKMRANGYFLLKLQTKNNQAKEAKNITLNVLQNFLNQPISQSQLQDGKDNIIGGFALQTASNANISAYLSIIGFYDLPLDYLSTFPNHIKNISSQDIQAAFNQLIKMDKLIVLSVGGR